MLFIFDVTKCLLSFPLSFSPAHEQGMRMGLGDGNRKRLTVLVKRFLISFLGVFGCSCLLHGGLAHI